MFRPFLGLCALSLFPSSVPATAQNAAPLEPPSTPQINEPERLETIYQSTEEMVKPSIFGIGIIIAAYLPILTLQGIEGKMFRPMGMTVIMALLGAMLLSITLTPALCAFFLVIRREKHNIVLDRVSRGYEPALRWTLQHRGVTALGATLFFGFCASSARAVGEHSKRGRPDSNFARKQQSPRGDSIQCA